MYVINIAITVIKLPIIACLLKLNIASSLSDQAIYKIIKYNKGNPQKNAPIFKYPGHASYIDDIYVNSPPIIPDNTMLIISCVII